jgi:DNA-directed RNA polymerase subunit omega
VHLAAKRAREINGYYAHLGEGLTQYIPPLMAVDSDKPLTIALEEIAAEKIVAVEPSDDVIADPLSFIEMEDARRSSRSRSSLTPATRTSDDGDRAGLMTTSRPVMPDACTEGGRTTSLAGRTVVVGVTGGIAAYKAALLVRLLLAEGAVVDVVMTRGAREFIGPVTFEGLTGRDRPHRGLGGRADGTHVQLGRRADASSSTRRPPTRSRSSRTDSPTTC